ncbi:MAG: biotin--[acetyl-CoA-carboxylase] ligase [Syntrophobacter sp.]
MPTTTPTQFEILRYLKESAGRFISGAHLAAKFKISRTGIWKHIQKLKALGYDILSHPKDGYQLVEIPDSLTAKEVVPHLETVWLGKSYHYLDVVDSTNNYALQLASKGASHGSVVVAEEQTHGRGRLRREWLSSPNRGIYMSLLLTNPLPLRVAPQSTYVAALALAKVLRDKFGLPAALKWPNDVLIGERKVAGLLTEMQSDQDFSRFIVIGIGINVNYTREEMAGPFRYPATSISLETGEPVKRQYVLVDFLSRFEKDYDAFVTSGFSAITAELENFSIILGKKITVLCGEREISGKAQGFTPEGALLLLGNDGKQEIVWAGDVTHVEGVV